MFFRPFTPFALVQLFSQSLGRVVMVPLHPALPKSSSHQRRRKARIVRARRSKLAAGRSRRQPHIARMRRRMRFNAP